MAAAAGPYSEVAASGRPALTDAATGTRLRFGTPWEPGRHVSAASFVVSAEQARVTGALFTSYMTIAREFSLPMVVYAPTSRATPDRCRAAGLAVRGPDNLNERCIRLLRAARDRVPGVEAFIAGVVGPARDAFDPSTGLSSSAARDFHETQTNLLVDAGCDLLVAAPFPTVAEAVGVAGLFARTGNEYLVALLVDADGDVLDGTALGEAIERIDAATSQPPVHYVIQCVHPRVAGVALRRLAAERPGALDRVGGVKANAADASLAALDGSSQLQGDDSEDWAQELYQLQRDYPLTLLGGCCGTDERHLFSLALRVGSSTDP